MIVETDNRGRRTRITLRSGAVLSIREDPDDENGDTVEISESTYRSLSIQPGARNAIFITAKEPQ